jgi:hypothetical protein
MRRNVICCLSVGLVVIIISVGFLPVSGSEIGWATGDEYTWLAKYDGGHSYEAVEDDLFASMELSENYKTRLNCKIIEINESTKKVTYEQTEGFQDETYESTRSYNTTELIEDFGEIQAGYDYDELNDTFLAVGFYMWQLWRLGYFIEPDWISINNELSKSLNYSRVVAFYNYNDREREFTLGEFLSGVPSYKIMGKTNLDEARNELTATTRRWTFEFDLSGYIYDGYWDYDLEERLYTPYDVYLYTFEIEYTPEGVLKHMLEEYKLEISFNGLKMVYFSFTEYILDGSGGGSSDLADGLDFTIVLVTFITISVNVNTRRKRRNKFY